MNERKACHTVTVGFSFVIEDVYLYPILCRRMQEARTISKAPKFLRERLKGAFAG